MTSEGRLIPGAVEGLRALSMVEAGDDHAWPGAVTRVLAWEEGNLYGLWELLAMVLARRGQTDAALEVLEHTGPYKEALAYDWLMLCPIFSHCAAVRGLISSARGHVQHLKK